MRWTVVVGDADELVVDPARMLEAQTLLAQDLGLGDLEAVLPKPRPPVVERGLGDRQHQDLGLVGAPRPTRPD